MSELIQAQGMQLRKFNILNQLFFVTRESAEIKNFNIFENIKQMFKEAESSLIIASES